jgi:polyhydroxybutyrate depolymerase
MRRITSGRLTSCVLALFLCLLLCCAVLNHNTTRLKSGTFRDDLNLLTGKYQRHFILHIPEGYNVSRPCPLVVVLHGAFSTAREMEKWSGWIRLADREGFIVIYPEGIGILGYLQHWNAGHCCGKAVEDDWNDVAFIEEAIDGMCRQYAVDKRRIYMVGFSNGGMMAYRFAAERSTKLAAVASVSGAIGSRASLDQPEWRLPIPERPVPVLIMHGASDDVIPFDGGKPVNRASTREYRPVSDAVGFWNTANHCVAVPVRKDAFGGMVTEESWTDADGRNEVRVFRIINWGHWWPGGFFTGALPENHPLKDFDTAQIIWQFFQRYPME